jgi:acyl carrier protein
MLNLDVAPGSQAGRLLTFQLEASLDLASSLRELWKQSLGLDDVALDDNFFALGGDSISAMILLAQIEELFGVMPDPGIVYDYPVLSQMVDAVDALIEPAKGPVFGD